MSKKPSPAPDLTRADLAALPLPTAAAFGVELLAWREARGATQEHLAALLGMDVRQVRRWENGHQRPAGAAAQRLEALRAGELAAQLQREIERLQRQIKMLEKIV